MNVRWIPLGLLALLVLVQANLWLGKGSLPYVWAMERQLEAQATVNAQARERNARAQAELNDLIDGNEMVEDKARNELGMLRPNEVLVRVAPKR